MAKQCACVDVSDFIFKLRHLDFNLEPGAGDQVTYRALVFDRYAPGAPEYSLSVTTARPRDDGEEVELKRFLEQLRAAFLLLAPGCDEEAPDAQGPHPVCASSDLLISPDLVRANIAGTFKVAFMVESTIADVRDDISGWQERIVRGARIAYNLPAQNLKKWHRHHYWSPNGSKISGAVVWKGGRFVVDGKHWLPNKNIGNVVGVYRSVITVRAKTFSTYDVLGGFLKRNPG